MIGVKMDEYFEFRDGGLYYTKKAKKELGKFIREALLKRYGKKLVSEDG